MKKIRKKYPRKYGRNTWNIYIWIRYYEYRRRR